jgi:membrane-bound ClpP family serine protease
MHPNQSPRKKPWLNKNDTRFDRQYSKLERSAPGFLARALKWLRHPYAQLVRIPIGILFVLGGIFSFLPLLGIWMLPLGLLLLAVDIPLLRGPVANILIRARRWLENRRRGKKGNKNKRV